MIAFQKFQLDNGLTVVVNEDDSFPTVAVNILYDVGSKDECADKTGLAHLFEHLMFGGSKHIPNFDAPLQQIGGSNNAYTSPDITNYHISLPYKNLETAFWLESDRMLALSFDPKVLAVQQKVVVEEFKQNYLNQPYGDLWLQIRPLAYKVHPYRWATIGKAIDHIEKITMDDIKAFFSKYYRPSNAILAVAGNVKLKQVQQLCQKWFAAIPAGEKPIRRLAPEPVQKRRQSLELAVDVPLESIFKAYHMVGKKHTDFYATDLLSNILGKGKSSRLHQILVQDKAMFANIYAFTTDAIEPGLFCIWGKLNPKISLEAGNEAIDEVINTLKTTQPTQEETLAKVRNQKETITAFEKAELINRANDLAYATLLGNTNLVNEASASLQKISPEAINTVAQAIFTDENSSTLYYCIKK